MWWIIGAAVFVCYFGWFAWEAKNAQQMPDDFDNDDDHNHDHYVV